MSDKDEKQSTAPETGAGEKAKEAAAASGGASEREGAGDQSAPTAVEETSEVAEAKKEAGIATAEQNAALEHTEGGATTRDGTDAGVPMEAGSPDEPTGPEDALGVGAKRGDYATRVDGSHAESVPVEGGGEPIRDEDGNVLDVKPKSTLVSQTERVAERGDVPGEKGGVTTS